MSRQTPEWDCARVVHVAHDHDHDHDSSRYIHHNRDSATSGNLATAFHRPMAARTVSELANWDGRLDNQRQNPKWTPSSSRDPHHAPLEDQSISHPLRMLSEKRRAEKLSNLERGSSTATTRLRSCANTTSTASHDMLHPRRASVVHTAPNPASSSSSPLITSSKSSHLTPNFSVHASRGHNLPHHSSRERVAPLRPASKNKSDVIDLTLEDTEDELSVTNMLLSNSTIRNRHNPDPGSSRRPFPSTSSPPIALERSLFTPPPLRKRRTQLLVAVPLFPKGLTKADYQPLSHYITTPSPGATATGTFTNSSLAAPSITEELAPAQKCKGKEREHDVISSPKQAASADEVDVDPGAVLDTSYEHIPLQDDDTYPPLTTWDLVTNMRFYFTEAWREHASRLREAEHEWISKYRLHERTSIWSHSGDNPLPSAPRTTSFVSSARLRPWELVPPESSPQEKATEHSLDEHAHATGSGAADSSDSDCMLLLPDDALPGSSTTSEPAPSNPTEAQGLTVTDAEHDMNQYFNGLGDSPVARIPSRQQPTQTHTFRPHLLQSASHGRMNSLGLEFPSMELDPRMTDTGDHECFLGLPPSPPPQLSTASDPIPEPPFESVNYFPPSPTIFEGSSAGTWPFEQEEDNLPINDPSSNDHVAPSISGTINPSLLGPEQSETQSCPPKATTPKRRSKLPEPVIYIRRPIDSSSLPLLPGKRSVQIKYRDSKGSPATPSTQAETNETPSNHDAILIERTGNHTDDPSRRKRRSAPSRRLTESYIASDSDSGRSPPPSTSRIVLKIKKPTLRDLESVAEPKLMEPEAVPTMSYCHQCRNKSTRPKMSCSNVVQGRVCGKRFCNRCILYRYPDVTFDEHSAGFLCPVCTNTCNCSFCSRNRGEEFVSMRLGGLATSLFTAKVTLLRDGDQPPPRPKSLSTNVDAQRSVSTPTTPTPEPSELPSQPQFWAHVYGMEGERVGRAFMTRNHMERLRAGGPSTSPTLTQPQSQPPKKARKPSKRYDRQDKPKGSRVFIGRPLVAWKIKAVRDLEPSLDVEAPGDKDKGESPGTGRESSTSSNHNRRRRRRCYIGSPTPLYEPYQRMPGPAALSSPCSTPAALDSDGRLTPLSNLEADNWPQPAVGEYCTWEPPAPPGMAAPESLSGPFVADPPGLGIPPGAVGMLPIVEGLQGLHIGGDAVDVEVVEGQASALTALAIPQEDMQRAISAALAAISTAPS